MILERASTFVLIGALVAGCATTNVDRARDISTAGIRYAQTTSAAVDVAIDSIIDADSEAQVRSKPRPTNLEAPSVRKERLKKLDDDLIGSVVHYANLRRSIGALEAYFHALQVLADGSQADATQAAVSTLADRVNSLNSALEQGRLDVKPVLTDAQKSALAGLSQIVAKQVHGAVVGRALERDAPVIGRALLLQHQVLTAAESDIANKITEANNRFYVDRVLGPYQKAAVDATWVDDRRTYIKAKALGLTLDTVRSVQSASAQMELVWNKILSGNVNSGEISNTLRETDELLAAVVALKAAEKSKSTP